MAKTHFVEDSSEKEASNFTTPRFKCHEIRGGNTFSMGTKRYYHLLFLLEGHGTISCNDCIDKKLKSRECVLIPIAADFIFKSLGKSRIMVFTFDDLNGLCDNTYITDVLELCRSKAKAGTFNALPIRRPLFNILKGMISFPVHKKDESSMNAIKQQEIFLIFQWFYTKEEFAALFHPVIGVSFDFRKAVLRNYKQVKNTVELAECMNMNVRTFTYHFKEEFGSSPYAWLLEQKAKHLRFTFVETDLALRQIRMEHGFESPTHFTRFCKRHFICTPFKLGKLLRQKQNPDLK